MAKLNFKVTAPEIGEALSQIIDDYSYDVMQGVDAASYRAVNRLVEITKQTAPVGVRKKFKRSISYNEVVRRRGEFTGRTYVWYVKPPNHRLTHLLVHGHETKDGGRTKPNPFLQKAIDEITPEYLDEVEDALKW